MRFLVFSDIHASNYKSFSKYVDGVNSRLLNIISCIEEIQKIGKKKKVDFYIFGGDLFHTQGYVESDVYNLTYDTFKKFDKAVFCVIGNHDNFNSEQSSDVSFLKFSEIPNIKMFGSTKSVVNNTILFFNYDKDLTTKHVIERINRETPKIVMLHQIPKGCIVNDYLFEDGVDWKELENYVDLVLFGHIHQPQKLSEKSYIIGSPLQHNFGDKGDRGVWIFDDESGKFKGEFIPLSFPQFLKVDKYTDIVKNDKFNYYMLLSGDSEVTANDNLIVSNIPEEVLNSRNVLNTTMATESVLSRYLEFKKIDAKDCDNYKKYGLEKLQKAESAVQSIVPSGYRLNKFSIEGFLSFKDKIEFKVKDGVWLVVGNSDIFTSNGSGKSSLFDSIFYGLYGKTSKGLTGDDVINFDLGKDCKVTLELVNDKSSLEISRFRKYKTQGSGLLIKENGKEISGTVQMLDKKLLGILGYDYDFFLNTVYYSQEKTEFFSSSTDAEKKTFLDSILQTEKYGLAQNYVKVDLNGVVRSIEESATKKSMYEQEVKEIDNTLEMLLIRVLEFEVERKTRLSAVIADKEKWQNDYDKENTKLEAFAQSDELDKKYKKLTSLIEEATENANKQKNELNMISSRLTAEIKALQSNYQKVLAKQSRAEKLTSDTICEVCGSQITSESVKKYIDILNLELTETNYSIELKDEIVDKNMEKLQVLTEEFNEEINEYRQSRSKVSEAIDERKLEISKLTNSVRTASNKLSELNTRIESIKKEVNVYSRQSEEKEKELKNTKNKLAELEVMVREGSKQKDLYEFWEIAYSNKGIKSLLFDEFCNDFNKEVIENIASLSVGSILVYLASQSKLKSGELSDKLSLKIISSGQERSYSSLSGGEKRRVDIAVMITLNKIIRKMYNISSGLLGILILDEIFSSLDSAGEENVYYLLRDTAKEIKSIFVITHTDELKSFFDNRITVVKKNNCSFIKV